MIYGEMIKKDNHSYIIGEICNSNGITKKFILSYHYKKLRGIQGISHSGIVM